GGNRGGAVQRGIAGPSALAFAQQFLEEVLGIAVRDDGAALDARSVLQHDAGHAPSPAQQAGYGRPEGDRSAALADRVRQRVPELADAAADGAGAALLMVGVPESGKVERGELGGRQAGERPERAEHRREAGCARVVGEELLGGAKL